MATIDAAANSIQPARRQPAEHLIATALPILLPPLMLRAHIQTTWVFVAFQLVETSTVHGGYDFFGEAAKKHDAIMKDLTCILGESDFWTTSSG
ncbi:sterol desaturase family [Trichoderma cornu-damae]|uniref:Sterol desaturase family n=1 Tax=Trichoderma cornu-damae TaxID=654480 RepID=A0A9P8QNK0_9HYPO|nr:sterol desaturase family [Trichoderma cornu-damae]